MALGYQESFRLSNGHPSGVACLSFSPDQTLLVSGGLEGNICVWDLRTQKLMTMASMSKKGTGVTSCIWKPDRNDAFLCGIQDGSVAEVTLTSSKISVVGIQLHDYPVEKLALHRDVLASGAHRQVRIWRSEAEERWVRLAELQGPPVANSGSAELIVTGLFFKDTDKRGGTLLVTYMHHGIMLHKADSWTVSQYIPYSGVIGDCDLHPDGLSLAISNCSAGFDIFQFETKKKKNYPAPGEQRRPLPVLFVHAGFALLTGSGTGKTCLRDVASKRTHANFGTGKDMKVLAIAACHDVAPDEKDDMLTIATGITAQTGGCDIIIWKARPAAFKSTRGRNHSGRTISSICSSFYSRVYQALVIFTGAVLIHLLLSSIGTDWQKVTS
ncbi:WD40 repeat-like protein [Trametopsis cervina]|nr:WD40 repeat-like protein [Trametopsis cervina]